MDERRASVLLARTPGLTAQSVLGAMRHAGDPGGAAVGGRATPGPSSTADPLAALRERRPPGVDRLAMIAAHLAAAVPPAVADADLRWLDASGAMAVPCTSPLYPPRLIGSASAPPVLYVLGDPSLLAAPQITVVGSRQATTTGRAIASEMAGAFASVGVVVTSGLALGIDAAGHEGALAGGGRTLAVCAHGLDLLYPRQHRELAARIRRQGALVSRFPPGEPPRRQHFPSRNHILSALGLATLVVEAARASGSLITARFAMQQGRPVFAVPGSIRNPQSSGCHELLREGARLAENPADVLQAIGIPIADQSLARTTGGRGARGPATPPLDKDSEILLDALGFEPLSLNTLVERTGLPASGIASMLLILELAGRVAPQSGGRYSRVC